MRCGNGMMSGQGRQLVLCDSSFGHDPHSTTEVFSNAFLMITIIAIAAKLRIEELYRGAFNSLFTMIVGRANKKTTKKTFHMCSIQFYCECLFNFIIFQICTRLFLVQRDSEAFYYLSQHHCATFGCGRMKTDFPERKIN